MKRKQLEAVAKLLDASSDEFRAIAQRSTNVSNMTINLVAFSVTVAILKALRAAIEVTDE